MNAEAYLRSMSTATPMSLGNFDAVAFRVAAEGVDSDRTAVSQLVRRAAHLGAPSVITDLVIDPREPGVARQRAFGEVLAFLGRIDNQPTSTSAALPAAAWRVHAALR